MILENKAYEIIEEFKNELINKSKNVIGIYAIGSLGGGYYIPGKSDIDTLILVNKDFELQQDKVDNIANCFYEKYNIPKGFGAIVIEESKLYPPYNYNDELVLEILRLKVQSEVVYGTYDLSKIPMPMSKDLIEDAKVFESWCDSEFGDKMFDRLSEVGCVNTILIHLKRYLMIKNGVIELNKLNTIDQFKRFSQYNLDNRMLDIVDNYLHGGKVSVSDLNKLKNFGNNLRKEFNKLLLDI